MNYHVHLYIADQTYAELERCASIETRYDDELYGCQWHLNNTTQNGNNSTGNMVGGDINAETAWDAGVLGEGVHVRVVDMGMDVEHEDIRENVAKEMNHDYDGKAWNNETSNGGDVSNPFELHGNIMAGLIAARDNDVGFRGVAPSITVALELRASESASCNGFPGSGLVPPAPPRLPDRQVSTLIK